MDLGIKTKSRFWESLAKAQEFWDCFSPSTKVEVGQLEYLEVMAAKNVEKDALKTSESVESILLTNILTQSFHTNQCHKL